MIINEVFIAAYKITVNIPIPYNSIYIKYIFTEIILTFYCIASYIAAVSLI